MNKISISRKVLIALIIHYPIFMAMHTIPFVLGHYLFPAISVDWFPVERWLIWVVPSIVLTIAFKEDLYISFKEMFTNKVKWKTLAWCILPVVFYAVGGLLIAKYTGFTTSGKLREFASTSEMWDDIFHNAKSCFTVPAIPEEMVFRAWAFNALLGKSPSKKRLILAIIISNVMFVIMHFPTYFSAHRGLLDFLWRCFAVFVIGSAFAIIFYKSKNILLPIFAHWLIDFIAFTFFA